MNTSLPFLFGAQYYRAPTPDSTCWAEDLRNMRRLGMNAVKLWVQWRWSHRLNDRMVFEDLDQLMDLARENSLQVTLNTIFDVAPHWLYQAYPDAKQVMQNGRIIEPYVVGHRQLGGHPGPCYRHPAALEERKKFLVAAVEHFRGHPALAMWDIWNEPELSFPQRSANIDTLACYCPHCQTAFRSWLEQKYPELENLNQVWGRCYETWDQVEVPRSTQVFTDFIDWREFHIDTMTAEARWRLDLVSRLDPDHTRYLHVVPNVMTVWNSISCCSDDFALAKECQVFAATMNGGPILAQQVLSAARGKLAYNVESHINFGHTAMHQRVLGLEDVLRDWLPQIGLGIRGFLFWQYRAETLGLEAPAWGLVNLDGSDRPVTRAVAETWRVLAPYTRAILDCPAPRPQIGIWKSIKNEIFHFCAQHTLQDLADDVEGYIQALYWENLPARIVDGEMLSQSDLDDLKLLILPSPYYLTPAEADSLDRWVRQGGVALVEAHLGGYNAAAGRHSTRMPGLGLDQAWGIQEIDPTSSYHLPLEQAEVYAGASPDDVRKALLGLGLSGGKYYPIQLKYPLTSTQPLWGALRYARLEGPGWTPLGSFDAVSCCLAYRSIGSGSVIYSTANLGIGALKAAQPLMSLLRLAAGWAGLASSLGAAVFPPAAAHIDPITDTSGLRFLVIHNREDAPASLRIEIPLRGRGLFSHRQFDAPAGSTIEVPARFIDMVVVEP